MQGQYNVNYDNDTAELYGTVSIQEAKYMLDFFQSNGYEEVVWGNSRSPVVVRKKKKEIEKNAEAK